MHKLLSRSRLLMEKGTDRPAKAPATNAPGGSLHGGPDKSAIYYNRRTTPLEVPSNAHQYACRPLPVTPSSEPDMTDRPSSSGDLGRRKTAKDHFQRDKRISRDDLYVGSSTYSGAGRSRGQPSGPAQPFTIGTNSREPSPDVRTDVDNGRIRMVLGGSTHLPDTRNLKEYANPIATPPTSGNDGAGALDVPLSRKPSGRWKFRSIFGRKQPGQPVPAVPISDAIGLDGRNNRSDKKGLMDSQALSSDVKIPARSNTTSSRKTPKHIPIIIRSQTLPLSTKDDIQHEGLREDGLREDRKLMHAPIAAKATTGPNPAAGSLLNVEIPDVHLERYSVMFNNVLNSNPSSATRRQVAVQKLKSMGDVTEREEDKSHGTAQGTSSEPAARSSGLVLFPTGKQSEQHISRRLSSRFRSNTSPALPLLPSKPTGNPMPGYKHPQGGETLNLPHPRHPSYQHVEKPLASVTKTHAMEPVLPPVPDEVSEDKSNFVLSPSTEIEAVGESTTRFDGKPVAYHLPLGSKRQMVSSSQNASSTASSYAESSYRKRSHTLASSPYTYATVSPTELDDIPYHNIQMTPAEVSIARQISVSRQQRKLVQTLNTGRAPSAPLSRKPSHASAARISPKSVVENGNEAETEPTTLTSVHRPEIQGPLAPARHGRSQRITLEDA